MPIRKEMRERYPKDWSVRSRFVRFVRARGRCEICGVPNGAMRDKDAPEVWFYYDGRDDRAAEAHFAGRRDRAAKVVLTCAHWYDHRPEAASLLNLKAACQRCHNRHDAKTRAAGVRERRHRGQLDFFRKGEG